MNTFLLPTRGILGIVKHACLLTAVFIVLALPMRVDAQAEALEEARAMVERQEFDAAQEALTTILETGDLGPEQLVEIYRSLAECGAALRQPEAATEAFINLLVIRPDFYVSSNASPLIRDPFEQALAFWEEHERPTLRYRAPPSIAADEPFVVAVDLDQETLPTLLATIRVHYRADDGGFFSTQDMENGRVELTPDRFSGSGQLQLFVSAHDSFGNVVARVGSPEEPLTIDIGEASVTPNPEDSNGRERPRRPVYQRWWFWTIIGVAVVGLAVGLPVGLTLSTPDDPCESALGGPCDLVVPLGQ